MWVIEWSCSSDSEFNVTAWASETEALKEACFEIISHIDMLDVSQDDELRTSAEIISNYIKSKDYRKAIHHWNDCDYNDSNDSPIFWTVRQLTPQHYNGDVPILNFIKIDEEETTTSTIANDHTCTMCGNTRCSKKEKFCWSCGTQI
jgi:hypothetical protein